METFNSKCARALLNGDRGTSNRYACKCARAPVYFSEEEVRLKDGEDQTATSTTKPQGLPANGTADTGNSIEGISDVHLHKADLSYSTFLLVPAVPHLRPPNDSFRSLPETSASFLPAIQKHSHFLFCLAVLPRLSARVLIVSPLCVLLPLFIAPFNPSLHILLIYPLCFSKKLKCLLHTRISLFSALNLVCSPSYYFTTWMFPSVVFFSFSLALLDAFIVSR